MPAMVDPYNALREYRKLHAAGLIPTERCEKHEHLVAHQDAPDGAPRIIFAFVPKRKVRAIVIFAEVQPHKGQKCFGIAYAVGRKYRDNGVATAVAGMAIEEFTEGLFSADPPLAKFYIEAIVGRKNVPSQKVAERVLTKKRRSTTDSLSGTPAFAYVRRFERE